MVRLPNARTPDLQRRFREIREELPKLFGPEEKVRNAHSWHRGITYALTMACKGSGGAHCRYEHDECDGTCHGDEQWYEEIVEALIGRVFLWADRPEKLKEEILTFLKRYDHIVETRLLSPVPVSEAEVADEMFLAHKRAVERLI